MSRRYAYGCWTVAASLGVAWAAVWCLGIRINTTASVPLGLWLERPASHALSRGDYVAICPTDTPVFRIARDRDYIEAGWCAGGYEVMFKPIAAVAGDVVQVSPDGIEVNGVAIANSAALTQDSKHQQLAAVRAGTYVVPAGWLWLVSSYNNRSFDSRYFGPLPATQVRGLVSPLLVDGAP